LKKERGVWGIMPQKKEKRKKKKEKRKKKKEKRKKKRPNNIT